MDQDSTVPPAVNVQDGEGKQLHKEGMVEKVSVTKDKPQIDLSNNAKETDRLQVRNRNEASQSGVRKTVGGEDSVCPQEKTVGKPEKTKQQSEACGEDSKESNDPTTDSKTPEEPKGESVSTSKPTSKPSLSKDRERSQEKSGQNLKMLLAKKTGSDSEWSVDSTTGLQGRKVVKTHKKASSRDNLANVEDLSKKFDDAVKSASTVKPSGDSKGITQLKQSRGSVRKPSNGTKDTDPKKMKGKDGK